MMKQTEVQMRKSCLECVAKHLGSAAVYAEEVELGYPNYYGFVYGELAHASSECLDEHPGLAWAIREHRIKWGESRGSGKPHKIPFEAMFDYIDVLKGASFDVKVPDEVLEGLKRGENGEVEYSLDTRPATDSNADGQ